jgi:type I restriction enzyme, S subunit
MTALVTKHLPLVAGAPEGIKRLRELILDLAIRGKLVEQDSTDEPATELIKKIAEHKAQFDAAKTRKASQPTSAAAVEVPPFDIPQGWSWARFGAVTICRDGERIPVSQADRVNRAKVFDYYGASGVIDKIDGYLFDKPLLLIGEDGANLINRATPIAFIAKGQYWVNNHAHVIDGISEGYLQYVALYINAIDLKPYVTGTAQPKMNQAKLNGIPVPIPPETEQHRILAKVDELMALCDRLEADQADAEAAHAQLVQALLDSLTQATDAADFRVSWQRLSEHFHAIFTTEASIDALKQTVLQLAVMGKLVPQSPGDEPALALLRQADVDKARLIAEGIIRKARGSSAKQSAQDEPFSIPSGWLWVKKSSVLRFLNGYAFKSEWFRPEGVRLLRNINIGHGVVDWSDVACVSADQADDFSAFALAAGDLVLTLDRPIISTGLKAAVIRKSDLPCLLLQRVAKLSPYADCIATGYLTIWLNSAFFIGAIDPGRSNGVPHISTSQVGEMLFALPPLAEQHRIIAKVDELMAVCDQLKTQLAESRQLHAQLADALVSQAVA